MVWAWMARGVAAVCVVSGVGLGMARAQEGGATVPAPDPVPASASASASASVSVSAALAAGRGPVTNLPLPRYVSLKTDEGNVRRGPSLSHRVDWVLRLRDMPLRVTAEHGHWRRVEDRDGAGGWIHFSLLSGVRTALVEADLAALRVRPLGDAPEVARLEAGVVARLGDCGPDWCRVTAGGYRGWLPKADLWGVDAAELRD